MLVVLIAILQAHTIFRLYLTDYWEGTHRLVASGELVAYFTKYTVWLHTLLLLALVSKICLEGRNNLSLISSLGIKLPAGACVQLYSSTATVLLTPHKILSLLFYCFLQSVFCTQAHKTFFSPETDVILIFSSLHHKLEDSGVISG